MEFRNWINLVELTTGELETVRGAQVFQNPALEVAMYMLYRQAYDSISEGGSAWSHSEWTRPSTGGTRAPAWIFTGIFPNEAELSVIQQALGESNDVQQVADQLLEAGNPALFQCGGVSYRDDKPGMIKLTGMWGKSSPAKMRAAAQIIHQANVSQKEIFTGADAALKNLIDKAEEKMPKFHQKGIVPAPSLGLSTPPKEVIPLLYDILVKNPAASSGGHWQGYNPETGGLKINLTGTGEREKFIYGNKQLWKNSVSKALAKGGVGPDKVTQAKQFLSAGGMMGNMAANQINKVLQKSFPGSAFVPASGLLWLLSAAEAG